MLLISIILSCYFWMFYISADAQYEDSQNIVFNIKIISLTYDQSYSPKNLWESPQHVCNQKNVGIR